jgi:uncharacterized membrane protein YcaP (DUF421 family)
MSSHYGPTVEWCLNSPPLIIAFRGNSLDQVMRKHRISTSDLNGALRKKSIWHISEVEAVIIESTGNFSIYKRCDMREDIEPQVLLDIPGYRRLVEHFDQEQDKNADNERNGKNQDQQAEETANDIADENA